MGQNLSIGQGCDYKAIVEHEILHALGFYHEQSRTDRDDYVNIWWDEILPGVYEPKVTGWVGFAITFITCWDQPWDDQAKPMCEQELQFLQEERRL